MNAKNVNEILDALAARLAVPASHLWSVLVRQAAVDFWSQLTVTAVLLFITWLVARYAKNHWAAWEAEAKATPYSTTGGDLWMIATVVLGSLSTLATLGFAIAVGLNVGRLINPEYYALQEVLSALR